ncbi:hypothetical protein SLEP1_g38538 [Rubroshorea leprosula]|nr:hypothetical protein SLEP1_g38538 [Rubroshorea leprosula]
MSCRSIYCLHNHTTNIGHGAGTQISANNIGPGTVGHNNNSGPGSGGFNSGDYSGSINNCRSYCEGNRMAAEVRRRGFDQGEYFSPNLPCAYCENTFPAIFNRSRVSSTHRPERKCRYCKRSGRIRRIWIPKRNAIERDKIFEFKTEKEEKAWLDCCAVGCLREPKDTLPAVSESLREQGFTFCKAVQMEGDLVLLHCPNNNDLSTLIDKGRVLLKRHFQWVKPWSPKIGDERYVYLRIEGVPLHAWTVRFFRMVVDRMRGRFISMDDSTINKKRLDIATVLIRTTSNEIISESLTGRIDSNDYNVKVIEETDQNSVAVDSNFDISDNDSAVVDGRLDVEQSDGDSSDKGFKEIVGREEEIFTGNSRSEFSRNTECNFQTAQQKCSSESHKNLNELGSQNVVPTKRLNAGVEPFSPEEKLNAKAKPSGPAHLSFPLICDGQEVADMDSPVVNIGRSEGKLPDKNQNELGSQNVVPTKRLNAGAKPFSPEEKLNAKAKPSGPANVSFPLICNGKEVSDKDSAVVNGRSEGELPDKGLCKGDEKERREEKILTRNRKSESIQTAQKTCSLGSKQDGCREADGEIGSNDKGSQEIFKNGPQKNHPGGSGSKNCGSDTSKTMGNGHKDGASSRDPMVKGDAIATQLQICQRSLPECQKEISMIRKRDKNASMGNGSSKSY